MTSDLDWNILNYDIYDFLLCIVTGNAFLMMMSKQMNITIGNSSTEVIITENDTTVESQFFMAEVETYMTYKIASYINIYWFPILVPIGLVGNTLSFLVMIQSSNRKMSTCIYMAAISIIDNLMMCLALHYWLVTVAKIHKLGLWECKINSYLTHFSIQSSTYQVLAMTIDKYIAIKWPHKAAVYSAAKRVRAIHFGVNVGALSYSFPDIFAASVVGGKCLSYSVGGTITRVYSWITFTINGIIPFTMLIYMNFVIVLTIRNSRKMFRSTIAANTGEQRNHGMETRQRKMKSAENQLTIMLVLVTMLFLILLFPTYIRFIYLIFVKRDTASKYASSMLFFQITHNLYTTNNGINFLLYCIGGKKFRNDLKAMLCCILKTHGSFTDESKST